MELSHEDIVTKLLSTQEILGIDGEFYDEDYNRVIPQYISNPIYDLNNFLKKHPTEPSRFGEKYIFVK